MKIVVVNHYAVPAGFPGGTRHHDLALAWAAAGHQVKILASGVNHFSKDVVMPARLSPAPSVEFVFVPGLTYEGNGPRRAMNMVGFAVRTLARYRDVHGADVYIGSTPHPLAAVAAWLLARIDQAAFVVEVRDLWPRSLVDLGGLRENGSAARVLYRLEAWLLTAAEHVVTVTPGMAAYFEERKIALRGTSFAPNASVEDAPDDRGPAQPGVQLVRRLQQEGKVVFCYAGSLGPANAVDEVVRAFLGRKPSDSAALVVVGGGPEEQRLRSMCGQGGPVHMLGQTSRTAARAIVRAADVSVFHLRDADVFRYGLCPNKLIDYLHSGRPILYAGPAVPNPTQGADCGIAARPCDPVDIARAVDEMIALSPSEREDLGRNGRLRAAEQYSLESVAAAYQALLEEAVVTRANRRGGRRRGPRWVRHLRAAGKGGPLSSTGRAHRQR